MTKPSTTALSAVLDRLEHTLTVASMPQVSVSQRTVLLRYAMAEFQLAHAITGGAA